jgi:CO dehydrogenase/acetyl-CoA synthase delta subunit
MIQADLYEKSIRIEAYVTQDDIEACECQSREIFLNALRMGNLHPSMCGMAKVRFLHLFWAAKPDEILPRTEVLQLPNPGSPGLFPVNEPDDESPILVSGNSESTISVLATVLSTTLSPFWYLVVDTDGHTVDMAMVYEVLTADRVALALHGEDADRIAPRSSIVIPGCAAGITDALAAQSRRFVTAGPVCAAELPLFFGEIRWTVIP